MDIPMAYQIVVAAVLFIAVSALAITIIDRRSSRQQVIPSPDLFTNEAVRVDAHQLGEDFSPDNHIGPPMWVVAVTFLALGSLITVGTLWGAGSDLVVPYFGTPDADRPTQFTYEVVLDYVPAAETHEDQVRGDSHSFEARGFIDCVWNDDSQSALFYFNSSEINDGNFKVLSRTPEAGVIDRDDALEGIIYLVEFQDNNGNVGSYSFEVPGVDDCTPL